MKITEAEFAENRREASKFYINQTLLGDSIKLVAFVAAAVVVGLIFMMD